MYNLTELRHKRWILKIIDYGLNSCIEGQDSENSITRKYSAVSATDLLSRELDWKCVSGLADERHVISHVDDQGKEAVHQAIVTSFQILSEDHDPAVGRDRAVENRLAFGSPPFIEALGADYDEFTIGQAGNVAAFRTEEISSLEPVFPVGRNH